MERIVQCVLAVVLVTVCSAGDWRQFRGTENNSVSTETNLPKTFGDDENLAWKVPLHGRGASGPIVVGGRVIVTASGGVAHDRLHVMAFDSKTGKLAWHRQLWATGHTAYNSFGSIACNTPASDGQLVFAFFSTNDLACFDLDGNLKWCRGLALDYPTMRNDVGMSSSPLVVGDVVMLQCENQGESFIAGLDKKTGETRWQNDRDHEAIWSSPTILRGKTSDEDLVLFQCREKLSAHDPETGEEVWKYEASCHTIASVTTDANRIYLPANGIHALEYDPETRSAKLLWYEQRLRGERASPVASGNRVFVVKSPAILISADAADGSILWQVRLKGPVWSTPVVADGHAYVVNYKGLVQVVRLGDKGELVGTTQIDPEVLASPAVSDGAVYFRTDRHLWKAALPK
jgi:outer membrane protein assembly factor BamB